MDIETFLLERNQSLYENAVEINLTESGVEPLTVGELLDPEEQAALLSLRLGYGHTEGTPALRAAVAGWYPGAGVDDVLITAGAAEANLLALWAACGPGDELVFVVPNFLQIPGIARAGGVVVRTVPLDADRGWALDRGALAAAVGPRTRLVALCNPNNPTGRVLDAAEMAAVVDIAGAAGAWLLADEIYRGAEIGGRPETPTFWGRYERTIVTASTSKALAHAGLRLGWMVAPPEMVGEAVRRQDYTTIGTGPMSQYIATRILQPGRRRALLARSRDILERNLAHIEAWVSRWNGRLSFRPPEAGGMAFVGYDAPVGSAELSRRIRERESVFVVAGAWFGVESHLRIGIGGDADVLEEGLRRIDRVLREI